MNIYLHVGYPKVASTWFKKKFLPHVKNIKVFERTIVRECFHDPGAFDFNAEDIKKKLFLKEEIDIWISEELLTDRSWTGGVQGFVTKEVANRLYKVYPNANIIFFIRNQIDILASFYLQYIKSGGNYGIQKFLFPEKYFPGGASRLIVSPEFFCYEKIIGYYCQLFGKERIHVFLYEEFKENPKAFITHFSNLFNLNVSIDDIDFTPSNMGYRQFLLPIRRFTNYFSRNGPLNKFYFFHIPKLNYISKMVLDKLNHYKLFGRKMKPTTILGKENENYFRDYYGKSNKILIDEYGLRSIEKYGYPLPLS